MEVWKFLVQEKPVAMMLALQQEVESYPSALARKVGTTFAHALHILSRLEEAGVVTSREEGRIRRVRLTDMGTELALILERLKGMAEVVEAYRSLQDLYAREVKGKLREEVDREKVIRTLEGLRERVRILSEREDEVGRRARKFLQRADEVEKEVKGIVVGAG
jgi:predicted transcriptional regulator